MLGPRRTCIRSMFTRLGQYNKSKAQTPTLWGDFTLIKDAAAHDSRAQHIRATRLGGATHGATHRRKAQVARHTSQVASRKSRRKSRRKSQVAAQVVTHVATRAQTHDPRRSSARAKVFGGNSPARRRCRFVRLRMRQFATKFS